MVPLVAAITFFTALFAVSAAAQAPARNARVGWISFNSAEASTLFREALLRGFSDLGYAEGRNLTLLSRYADDKQEAVVPLARELVDAKVDVLIASGAATPPTLASVRNVPVVYAFSGDPVAAGFAKSLAQPREGTTGITWLSTDLNGKRIQLLKEAFPALRRLAILANPHHPGEDIEKAECEKAADTLGLTLIYLRARDPQEIEDALQRLDAGGGADAMIALPDMLIMGHRARIIGFGVERRMPVVSGWGRFAHSGGLLTYGPNLPQTLQRLTNHVHRILGGTRPENLPIEQPTSFELVVNLKTARRLGIELPPMLLQSADEVIE